MFRKEWVWSFSGPIGQREHGWWCFSSQRPCSDVETDQVQVLEISSPCVIASLHVLRVQAGPDVSPEYRFHQTWSVVVPDLEEPVCAGWFLHVECRRRHLLSQSRRTRNTHRLSGDILKTV